MTGVVGDGFEALGYLVGFWVFVFNSKYRKALLQEFQGASNLEKGITLLQAAISFVVGAVLPIYLLYLLAEH